MKSAKSIIAIALLLGACVLAPTVWHNRCETQTLTGSFTVLPSTSTPTPTPANETVEPTSVLTINVIGKTTEWRQNEAGMVLEEVSTSSRDQRITMYISQGTTILGPDFAPLDHIFIGVIDPFTKSPPSNLPNNSYFVDIYEFTPEGTIFSQAITIQLSYEESDIPGNINETTLKVFQLQPDTGDWILIPSVTNAYVDTVTFSTSHFSIYALIASPLQNSTSIPTTTALPTSSSSSNQTCSCWIWVVIILATECLILNMILIIYLYNKRHQLKNGWK